MPRPRVLVTDAEVNKSLAVVRALGEAFEIVTCSNQRPAVAAWSRFSSLHLRSPSGLDFVPWLLEAVRKHSIEVLMCPQETTLALAASAYEALEAAGLCLTFPRSEILDLAIDKAKTLTIAKEAGIAIPPTVILKAHDQAIEAAEQLGFPVVVKPRRSKFLSGTEWIGGQGPVYADSAQQLEAIVQGLDRREPPPIVQGYVPGRGTAIFLLLDRRGRPCASFAHRRLRDVRPTGSGSVLRESIATDPALLESSLALLGRMNWWGIAMVEYRTDERTGNSVLMEVNGRFWGSLQLATDSGVNFARLLYEVARGESPRAFDYREGVILRWWFGDLLRTLRVLKGPPAGFPGRFPGRWQALREFAGPQPAGTRNEVVRLGDPCPGIGELVSILGRML